MFKKIVITLAFLFVMTGTVVFAADQYGGYDLPVDIQVNGDYINCVKKPFLESGSTYIPLRAFSEAIGAQIEWNEEAQTATMIKDGHKFEFCSDNDYCIIDGEKRELSSINREFLTFVPVRVISETLGYGVEWDDYYMTVKITAPDVTVPEESKDFSYTYSDILYLGKIIMLEAGSGTLDTKIAIGNTIVNRVQSSSFPNTIKDVIFDTNYGTQFPPAHTERIEETPSKECVVAAKCALNGVELVGNSLYFISAKAAPKSWAAKNRPYHSTVGNTAFYE
ncbi:MAG: cell wall hydrolase [Clostridia bacterium]|nr:cell wall hydrolase [Clostridia bacterium]